MNQRHVEALIYAGAHPDIAEALACDHAAALGGAEELGGPRLLAFEAARTVREFARPAFLAQVERERAAQDVPFGTVEEGGTP